MSFLKKVTSALFGGSDRKEDRNAHWEYVRCSRCGEKLRVRVDPRSELTPQYEDGESAYYARKGVYGSGKNRCFQMVEVELFFDSSRRLTSRYVTGGEFIARDEFYAGEDPVERVN